MFVAAHFQWMMDMFIKEEGLEWTLDCLDNITICGTWYQLSEKKITLNWIKRDMLDISRYKWKCGGNGIASSLYK